MQIRYMSLQLLLLLQHNNKSNCTYKTIINVKTCHITRQSDPKEFISHSATVMFIFRLTNTLDMNFFLFK